MCGIAGWLGEPGLDLGEQDAIQSIQCHRGPDDEGRFVGLSGRVGLLHRRLSIIDLSPLGHQPMTNEDGSVVLCFNGEIYNFAGLRRELESHGHVFRSRTDSEVLVHGWEEWGSGVLDRIRGMFAFALWDQRRKMLFLARDPMGMKPLYGWWGPSGRLAFASELKSLRVLEGFSSRPDRQSIRQFMEFNFVPDPVRTGLDGVWKLPAGHFMRITALDVAAGRQPEAQRYFTPPRVVRWDGRAESMDVRADRLYDVLSEVVSQHMVADVPVGLLLSGGLDSSVVAALARRNGPVRTMSMAFADSTIDERPYARTVASFLGTVHEEVVIRPEEVVEGLDTASWFVDDLFGDWGVISTMVLYRKCRATGIRVVLVGEGSDEIFGGYPDYESAGGAEADGLGANTRALRLYRWFSGRRWGRGLAEVVAAVRRLDRETDGDAFSTVRLFETQHQMPNNYNMKVDKASMAASVEARVPFLDQRVAEEGYRTPRELLLRGGTNKFLLRYMAERKALLPKSIVWREKFGASIANSWIESSGSFRSFARETVLDPGGWAGPLGLQRAMEAYFDRGRSGYRAPSGLGILSIVAWRLLMLNLWARHSLGTASVR